MSPRYAVSCGHVTHPRTPSQWQPIKLDLTPTRGNVQLRSRDITRKLVRNLEPVWSDLMEIATYVYVADQAAKRDNSAESLGTDWRRDFSFAIPVRCLDVWSDTRVTNALVELLNFVSGDRFSFHFSMLKGDAAVQLTLLTERELAHQDIDEIVLFSGGLDSLAGAVEMGGQQGKKLLLVSHRSTPKISSRQSILADKLSQRFGHRRFFHVPVWINKDKQLSEEFTQRTRTFLFASLAGAMAALLERFRIHFFENGITSLNLPIAGQLVGTRVSRSTHPQVLAGLSGLLTLLAGRPFAVRNNLFWRTKTDIVNLIGDSGCADLIAQSVSCHHTRGMLRLQSHCGRCSQCLGRRIATLASNYGDLEPTEIYKTDLWTGERKPGQDLTLMESTILYAQTVRSMTEREFMGKSGEILSALGSLGGNRARNLRRIFKLHQRHSEDVDRVIDMGIARHAEEIRNNSLLTTCMLSVSMDRSRGSQRHVQQFPALPGLSATDDFRTVWVNKTEYTFTATQAACVQYFVEQSRDGPASISQAAILESADSRCKTLKSLFKRSPAWKRLIISGKQKGTYRLNLSV